ncbi:MAG: hypothetical protein HYU41_13270 [Candidatus Rokubacteria bacterium]|nr:hypothetical protein [Candidatus Rokubacteria bacterium]
MDWPGLVRKYVWDEERTPYLVRTDRLTARQARSELFVYAFLLALLAMAVSAIALFGDTWRGGASPVAAVYALTILAAAVMLGVTGRPAAAAYCATAPLAMVCAAVFGVLRSDMTGAERVVMTAAGILWLGYAARIIRIVRRLGGLD